MILAIIVIVLVLVIYLYGTRTFKYWEKKGVKHDKPVPLFGNNTRQFLMKKSITQLAVEMYWKYPKERFVGFYRASVPELVIRDPELIKRILVADFMHFYPRGLNSHKTVIEPMLRNLFFADGDTWRLLRQRMTPAFTSGKLKAMFPLIVERAERLQIQANTAAETGKTIDIRDLMARYTTDFIGACGFGIDTDSLSDQNSKFRKLGVDIFHVSPRDALVGFLKEAFPELSKHLKLLGQVEEDLISLVKEIIKQRNYKPSGRNDFIDLLLELKEKGVIVGESIEKVNADGKPEIAKLELDDVLMAAQVFVFFAAGFETSSSATSMTLHQLAYHPEEQRKVQTEIDRVLAKYDNKLCYDAVKEMDYLVMAFQEAMRIFPSLGFLIRQCARKYTIPDTDITIDEGVGIIIPVQAIHNDEQYFDNPKEFRPERFLPDEVSKRHKYVYLPFGVGPRVCIGKL